MDAPNDTPPHGIRVSGRFEGRYEAAYTDSHPLGHAERFALRILSARITDARLIEAHRGTAPLSGPSYRMPALDDVRISTSEPPQSPGDRPFLESLREIVILAPRLEATWREGPLVGGLLVGDVEARIFEPEAPSIPPTSATPPSAVPAASGAASTGRRTGTHARPGETSPHRRVAAARGAPHTEQAAAGCLAAVGVMLVIITVLTIGRLVVDTLARHPALLSVGMPTIALAIAAISLVPVSGSADAIAVRPIRVRLLHAGVALVGWSLIAVGCGAPSYVIGIGLAVLGLGTVLLFWRPPALRLGRIAGVSMLSGIIPTVPFGATISHVAGAGRLLSMACLGSAVAAICLTYATGLHHYLLAFFGVLPISVIVVPLICVMAVGIGGAPGALVALGAIAAAFIVPASLEGSALSVACGAGAAVLAALTTGVVTGIGLAVPAMRARPRLLTVGAILLPVLTIALLSAV